MVDNEGFVKLYGSIVDSSVWQQPLHVRVLWVSMLALAKKTGIVRAGTVSRLAQLANLTQEETEQAITVLEAPDPDSAKDGDDGTRVRREQGYWQVLNHGRYRDHQTPRQAAAAMHMREVRERERTARNQTGKSAHALAALAPDPDHRSRREEDLSITPPSPQTDPRDLRTELPYARTRDIRSTPRGAGPIQKPFRRFVQEPLRAAAQPPLAAPIPPTLLPADPLGLPSAASEPRMRSADKPSPLAPLVRASLTLLRETDHKHHA